jgi:hypothetical protein
VQIKTSVISTYSELCNQSGELRCRRSWRVLLGEHLTFAHGLPHLNPRKRTAGRPDRVDAPQRTRAPFPGARGRRHEVLKRLRVPQDKGGRVRLVGGPERGRGAAPLLERDFLGAPLGAHGLA